MADLSSLSTFSQTVMGNKRVVYVHVPGGGSTADLVVIPHVLGLDFASACFRSSVVTASSVQPALSIDGTTINIFRLAATTATAFTIRAEGR